VYDVVQMIFGNLEKDVKHEVPAKLQVEFVAVRKPVQAFLVKLLNLCVLLFFKLSEIELASFFVGFLARTLFMNCCCFLKLSIGGFVDVVEFVALLNEFLDVAEHIADRLHFFCVLE
jgi:hypothetical protein